MFKADLNGSKPKKLIDPYECVLCPYGISYRLTYPVLTAPLLSSI